MERVDRIDNNYLAKVLPTFLCNLCGSEFKFLPCTSIDEDVKKEEPKFCPYCGRENTVLADRRTSFKKIGILDSADNLEEGLDEDEKSGGICV
jgi:hypothetical protein